MNEKKFVKKLSLKWSLGFKNYITFWYLYMNKILDCTTESIDARMTRIWKLFF